MRRRTLTRTTRKYNYAGLLYISPWIAGFLAFQLYPFLASFFYSFTDFNLVSTPSFVGLRNYVKIFSRDADFYQSLKVTAIYSVIAIPARLLFALFVALLLNVKLRFIHLYRTVFYLPSILGGSVAISILWRFLFMWEGVVNKVLSNLTIPPQNWLGDPRIALYTISLLAVLQFGSSMIIFLAGLKQIPNEFYEASRIDGANAVQRFVRITIPLLTPVIFFNLVMQTINALQEFTSAFVVTNGGPLKATYFYVLNLFQQGFHFFRMGYASALSWILFAIIIILTVAIFKTSPLWIHYEEGGDL